jgi:hypothetical protein
MNRSIAIAMRDSPEAGLNLIENILRRGDLNHYPLAHADHADLCRRLGRNQQARSAPQRSLSRHLTPAGSHGKFGESPRRSAADQGRPVCGNSRTARGLFFSRTENPDEAIVIAGRVPAAVKGTVEIRPLFELEGLPKI